MASNSNHKTEKLNGFPKTKCENGKSDHQNGTSLSASLVDCDSPSKSRSNQPVLSPQSKRMSDTVCINVSSDSDKLAMNGGDSNGVSVRIPQDSTNGVEKDMITEDLVRHKAFKWCQDSLGGTWASIPSEKDLVISPVTGGMSNYLYLISLPPSHKAVGSEPSCVLLRIYGEISKSTMDFLIHNSVVFALLAEKQLGPQPYGMYHDGRIEEFIKAIPLKATELTRPDIIAMLSKKIAHFHSFNMPLCKKPTWFKSFVRGWMTDAQKNDDVLSTALENIKKLSPGLDFNKEFGLLQKIGNELHAPVVFCHNDLQPGNLLYKSATDSEPAHMTIIDWEYAHYNYRGFDLANHFVEWAFDYSSSGLPGYECIPERFPSKAEQYEFFQSYLQYKSGGLEVTQDALDRLYKETNFLVLYSHFFWAFWALIQSLTSSIEFDYTGYALCRFREYFRHKELLKKMFGEFE